MSITQHGQGRQVYEPGLIVKWNSSNIDASVRTAYRKDNFDDKFKSQSTSDNRSFHVVADFSFSPVPVFSIDLFNEYQYRVYEPFGKCARTSENITLSANATFRFKK